MKYELARIVAVILAFFLLSGPVLSLAQASGQIRPDYREIFGDDYDFGVKTIDNNPWWTDTLLIDGLDPGFALAIIFPELIRYSSISDYIEVKALEVLYVQYGRDYADFSICLFQMKPSFAERIEADILQYTLTDKFPTLSSLNPEATNDVATREKRIIRLKDEYFQLLYLEAFIRIMDTLYPDSRFQSKEDKLIFYATAYNTGYFKDEAIIRDESTRKRFYRGMDQISVKYSYSDISLGYFISKRER
jgi:hypothetical protein